MRGGEREMGQKGSPVTHYSGASSKRQLKAKRAMLRGKSRKRSGGAAGRKGAGR